MKIQCKNFIDIHDYIPALYTSVNTNLYFLVTITSKFFHDSISRYHLKALFLLLL